MPSDSDLEIADMAVGNLPPSTLLIHCPLSEGGIAEHTHYQARAAVHAGFAVRVLAPPNYLPDDRQVNYEVIRTLWPSAMASQFKLVRQAYFAFSIMMNHLVLVATIVRYRYKNVLLAASSETLALLCVWPHIVLSRLGVRYAVNIHDPRRLQRGASARMHKLAVAMSFKPISIGLIHEDFAEEQPDIPPHVRRVQVPYGCYDANVTGADGSRLRASVSPPPARRSVFLSFGYIVDRKNIDLFIRALPSRQDVALIVAGRAASSNDRPVSFYRELASELGVADRVRIDDRFIKEEEIKDYFDASDVMLLTYSREFISQSGVLLTAATFSKLVLASSGDGPLPKAVAKFNLGVVVEPDSQSEIERGIDLIVARDVNAEDFARFRYYCSWERNVEALMAAFDDVERRAPAGTESVNSNN